MHDVLAKVECSSGRTSLLHCRVLSCEGSNLWLCNREKVTSAFVNSPLSNLRRCRTELPEFIPSRRSEFSILSPTFTKKLCNDPPESPRVSDCANASVFVLALVSVQLKNMVIIRPLDSARRPQRMHMFINQTSCINS